VTIAFLIARRISAVRAILFVVAQCAGAIAGAALLYLLTPENVRGDIGLTSINVALNLQQAFGVELIITFVLVFTVFASVDPSRRDLNGSAPLTIGLSVTLCHLFAVSFLSHFDSHVNVALNPLITILKCHFYRRYIREVLDLSFTLISSARKNRTNYISFFLKHYQPSSSETKYWQACSK
jgi:Major intrinsic protein